MAAGAPFTNFAAAWLARTAPNLLAGEPPAPLMQAFIAQSVIFGVGLILFGIATLLARPITTTPSSLRSPFRAPPGELVRFPGRVTTVIRGFEGNLR